MEVSQISGSVREMLKEDAELVKGKPMRGGGSRWGAGEGVVRKGRQKTGGAAARKSKDKKMLKDSRLTRTHREEKSKRTNHKGGTEEKWLQLCAMRVYVLYKGALYCTLCTCTCDFRMNSQENGSKT